ncbi:MAG: FAD-dependent oxidoreductase, partial [Clostridia bacterium]|nr:FAD-dependent oxidoreductase [Clostridia bacterium]
VTGNEYAEKLVEQVIAQGAEVEFCEVTEVKNGEIKTVVTDSGEFEAKAVVIATGAKHRLLGLEKEEQFIGEGISFCAVCDGAFYRDKTVAVIGGGNSALQEALLLAELAKKVYIIQNLDFLTGEEMLQKQIENKNNIEVILGATVDSLFGDTEFKGIVIANQSDGSKSEITLDGMFVAIGLIPQNDIFSDLITLDERGYADSNEACLTATEGVFVAGDCRKKEVRQLTTAMADGATAALAACKFIDSKK